MSPAHVSDNLAVSGGANHLLGPSSPTPSSSGRDLVPRVIRRRYVTSRRLLSLNAHPLKRTRVIRRRGVAGYESRNSDTLISRHSQQPSRAASPRQRSSSSHVLA
ncbi:hypothetical protein E2C01_081224 [Portunus trituberculatus]|uniref:Uncharacterized protein n=1 Tax=Portunus trituberculatus TaxID=210409 RepID=A0A5B7IY45_PORTR|nr:hypothetical protein [Portunus trituberculatus]